MPRLKVFIRSPQQRHKLLRFTPVGRKKPITRHAAVIIEAKYLELLRRGYEVTVGRTGDSITISVLLLECHFHISRGVKTTLLWMSKSHFKKMSSLHKRKG